jgi:S-formylglutathione hydrolase FrmB
VGNTYCGAWSEVLIADHPCEIYEPPRPHAAGLVAIYLHGVHLQSLRDQPEFCALFDQFGLRVACPRTQRSWWVDRICEEFDPAITAERYIVDRVLPFLAEYWNAAPPRIGLFGTSMGGQGALRFGFKYPNKFPVVVAISPAIDFQQRIHEGDETLYAMYRDVEDARQDTATLHVHPLNWPRNLWFCCDPEDERWHESAERLRMKLSALGVPHAYDLDTSGGKHGFEYYCKMAPAALGFMMERLEQEQRRVV